MGRRSLPAHARRAHLPAPSDGPSLLWRSRHDRRINFLEAALRLVVGLAFIAVSSATKLPSVFFWFGAVLAITAIPLMVLHRLHRRQAAWVIPLTQRILPLMGVVALALGGLIVWTTV